LDNKKERECSSERASKRGRGIEGKRNNLSLSLSLSLFLSLSSPPKGQKENGRYKTPLLITLYVNILYFKLYYIY
jgi:hypothetical protein